MKGEEGGPLAGEVIVFTGRLAMPRRETALLAARAGIDVADSVTNDTTLLVVGDQDLRRLDGHDKSTKHRKAEQLMGQGATLRILGESDFNLLLSLYGLNPDPVTDPLPEPRPKDALVVTEMSPEARRITDLVEAVRTAKREDRLEDACNLLIEEVERQEAESAQNGYGVAPWYYEQLAIVYRKQGRDLDELAILERYDRQRKAPGGTPAILAARLEKVRARLQKNSVA
ncbi:MAG: polymerase subunit epsilon [Hyphomicrobiales bacterium]|jgi:hypothetical protein|nr:polymerase subunit epsilon [Hyphomicrobiales bacterium]